MLFVIMCNDKPDCNELRMAVRPQHLAYLKTYEKYIKVCGPLLNKDEKSCGSLIMIEMDDRAAAEGFADSDPYTKAGLFESVIIRPMKMIASDGKMLAT
ncbi:YciI family protein [Commensalibacter communis]|uniref:YciI family protein n=1 Tax=Commensalibacter communis TaxID=2972786 RepID=UPI0022FF5AA5|nr:YciI family protein [Commensalibacter communis]CAI3925135.1 YciI superfamily enzyme [Commensalibacter communis]CAI3929513.1 YciI superfamily enzyme [Commensalibacter communis]